jgi:hypothetical protein
MKHIEVPKLPTYVPEEMFARGDVCSLEEKRIEENPFYSVYSIRFKSGIVTPYEENNTAYFLFFLPRKVKDNTNIVILHGLRANRACYESKIATCLALRGLPSSLYSLPYHRERTPAGTKSGSLFFTLDAKRNIDAYRQTIIDICLYGDVMERRGYSLAGIGISLGAIILDTLMGVDERFKKGISIVGAGNIQKIVWEGLAGKFVKIFLKRLGVREKHYREMLEDYSKFREEIRQSGKIPNPTWVWWLLDPLTYVHKNNPRDILMINSRLDPIIPKTAVMEFWRESGRPELVWFFTGHLLLLRRSAVKDRIIRFFGV